MQRHRQQRVDAGRQARCRAYQDVTECRLVMQLAMILERLDGHVDRELISQRRDSGRQQGRFELAVHTWHPRRQ